MVNELMCWLTANGKRDYPLFRFRSVVHLERKIDQAMRCRFHPELQLETHLIKADLKILCAVGVKAGSSCRLIKAMEIERDGRACGDELHRDGPEEKVARVRGERAEKRDKSA